MIVGHAAGVTAAQAIQSHVPLWRIDVRRLQEELWRQKQIVSVRR